MEWTTWIPTAVLSVLIFLGRNWIKASIGKGVEHKFNTKIETLRAELRKNEEEFKSELRTKETQISALRDGVLSGRANRQALVDKRRIEAVERVWKAVIELAPFKIISATMAAIKFDEAAKATPTDPNVRKLFGIIGNTQTNDNPPENPARFEQPFVSLLAWAYFAAYQSVVYHSYAKLKVLELGIKEPGELINTEHVENLLKTALPHMTKYIDENDSSVYHYLLDELEKKLLAELTKMLQGEDIDEESAKQSLDIMKKVEKLTADTEEFSRAGDTEKLPGTGRLPAGNTPPTGNNPARPPNTRE
jgi:hypothetical protein